MVLLFSENAINELKSNRQETRFSVQLFRANFAKLKFYKSNSETGTTQMNLVRDSGIRNRACIFLLCRPLYGRKEKRCWRVQNVGRNFRD